VGKQYGLEMPFPDVSWVATVVRATGIGAPKGSDRGRKDKPQAQLPHGE
jgi:hypothetical protein